MNKIEIVKHIELNNPAMIAGWPGMGSVALGVVDYLRRKLKAVKFAEIRTDPMSALDSVIVDNGLASFPPVPTYAFYYTKNPDLIIFEGEAQLPGDAGIDLLNKVLDLAGNLNTTRIYTGAAFPLPVSHKDRPQLYCAANKRTLTGNLVKFGINVMENGHISGLNGLLLGFARKRNMDAACLLSTMPQYAVTLPNPRASRAIIEILQKINGFKIDLAELDRHIEDSDERMAAIEEKVKDMFFTIEKDTALIIPVEKEKKIPSYIMEKIEKLFLEARENREKAILLKKELDRWDLFRMYEDRFLDLFRGNQ